MKKRIGLLLGIMMLATSSVALGFSDVLPRDWYYREVTELKARGVTRGYEDGSFRPNRPVSNAEALTMILRGKGTDLNESAGSSHWAEAAIIKGTELSIIDRNNFNRDEEAKREEVISMIVKALELENTPVLKNHFEDSTNKYANILYQEGLLKGEITDGKLYFRPNRPINRAEMGALTVRLIDYIDISNYDSSKYTDNKYFEFDKATGTILGYSSDGPKEVVIPEVIDGTFVRQIGDSSFYEQGIRSVIIPTRVSAIGDWAFAHNSLDQLLMPSSLSYIGKGALYANDLNKVTLPEGLLNIDDWAFAYNKLGSIYVPSSVRTIGAGAFYENSIARAEVPRSTSSIGSWAFDQGTPVVRY